jgi:endonuclease/exonuclease/phosphatase family metal-dependent hydrolase
MQENGNYEHKIDSESRWEKITNKLNTFMNEEHIIGLQELTLQRATETLPKIIEDNNYTMVYHSYGYEKNGYMGTAILIPNKYQILEIDNICIGEFIENSVEQNIMNLVKLREPNTGHIFMVANYHMPCKYEEPTIMENHAKVILHLLQTQYPTIFVGDLNFMPDNQLYSLMHSHFNSIWNYTLPNSTCHSYVKRDFKGCLDYIFFTKELIDMVKVLEIESTEKLMPNEEQPSDHVSLTAILRL